MAVFSVSTYNCAYFNLLFLNSLASNICKVHVCVNISGTDKKCFQNNTQPFKKTSALYYKSTFLNKLKSQATYKLQDTRETLP